MSPVTPTVLAVDAGNSKTDVALVGVDGALLGTARGGPFRPHQVGAEEAIAGLAVLVAEARADAGLGDHSPAVRHMTACLANADLPSEVAALDTAIAARSWAQTQDVVNDTFALLRTGRDPGRVRQDGQRGVAVICGAGTNCTGVLPDGTTVRFAALGEISGDWGGGEHLWREAMWWAARAEDGRGPDTALRTALPHHLGLGSMAALIEAVHLGTVSERRCLELTPVLFAAAEAGDLVAADLVRRQAREVVAFAATAIRRLGVPDEPIDVLLGGAVLTAGHPLLMGEIERGLAEAAPRAVPRVVSAPPIVGAALLALDRIGADPAAEERLRRAFRPPAS